MADYISKQAAIDAVHKSILDFFDICDDDEESPMTYKDERLLELNKAITTQIKATPSADTVEVVRCKDCKYWDVFDIHSTICPNNKRCRGIIGKMYTEPNHYCAYGERKDKGGE